MAAPLRYSTRRRRGSIEFRRAYNHGSRETAATRRAVAGSAVGVASRRCHYRALVPRRPDPGQFRRHAHNRRIRQRRQATRSGSDNRDALASATGHPDRGRVRAGLRGEFVAWHWCAQEYARRDRRQAEQGDQRGPRRSDAESAARRFGWCADADDARRLRAVHRRRDREVGQGCQICSPQAGVNRAIRDRTFHNCRYRNFGSPGATSLHRGRRTVNTEPLPGSLATVTSPPIMRASLREMASPSPVPPKRRAVAASAWLNSSNSFACCSAVMPMPVSTTASSIPLPPLATLRACSLTSPCLVNLQALLSRLSSICRSRMGSAVRTPRFSWASTTRRFLFFSASCPAVPMTSLISGASCTVCGLNSSFPVSIFDRSSTWLMRPRR